MSNRQPIKEKPSNIFCPICNDHSSSKYLCYPENTPKIKIGVLNTWKCNNCKYIFEAVPSIYTVTTSCMGCPCLLEKNMCFWYDSKVNVNKPCGNRFEELPEFNQSQLGGHET